MPSAADLLNEYNGYSGQVSDFMTTGNESDLTKLMQEKADYNKPIRAEQGAILAAKGDIINRYNSTGDPLINGLAMDQRERLKAYDTQQHNARSAELGSYMAAREGTLSDTVKSWKDAWNTKLTAIQAQQQAKKDAWQMQWDAEKEAQRKAEAAAALQAQYAQIAASKEANTQKSTIFDDVDQMIQDGVGWGDINAKLSGKGVDTKQGSDIDQYLRYRLIGSDKLIQSGEWGPLRRAKDLGFYTGPLPSVKGGNANQSTLDTINSYLQ